jgi:hypothetical protein
MMIRVRVPGRTGLAVAALAAVLSAQTGGTEKEKPTVITRLYTGPDGETHFEKIEAQFTRSGINDVFQLMAVSGAELHRVPHGEVRDFHPTPRRRYAITMAGEEEIEVAGGAKLHFRPGDIQLAEDMTGKGHLSRVVGNEDYVALFLPVAGAAAGGR